MKSIAKMRDISTGRIAAGLAAAMLCLACCPRFAGAAFEDLGFGARGPGMGDAFTAAADDADALYWNPAGLNYVPRLQETFGHNVWIDGINSEHLAFAFRSKPNVVMGAGISYVNVGDIERADKYGNAFLPGSTKNMAVAMAMAADHVILEAEKIVEAGELDPEKVTIPGVFVSAIVKSTLPASNLQLKP